MNNNQIKTLTKESDMTVELKKIIEENRKLKTQIKYMDRQISEFSQQIEDLQLALSEILVDDLINEAIHGVTESKGN